MKSIPSAPGYLATSDGEIIGLSGRRLKPFLAGRYYRVAIYSQGFVKRRLVSRLVCEAFHGAPPTPCHEAAHWNRTPIDNRETNLRWATRVENKADMVRHGTRIRGQQINTAKLTEESVKTIRARYASHMQNRPNRTYADRGFASELAQNYGISTSGLSRVVRFLTWRTVE